MQFLSQILPSLGLHHHVLMLALTSSQPGMSSGIHESGISKCRWLGVGVDWGGLHLLRILVERPVRPHYLRHHQTQVPLLALFTPIESSNVAGRLPRSLGGISLATDLHSSTAALERPFGVAAYHPITGQMFPRET